nr:hypothetical protein MEP433_gp49 [Methylophilales phage MEP433]WOZ55730.1 hypothetical protein MEP434_gp48 [Methylophilales phage MEP434]
MDITKTLVSLIALITAFLSGDYLDAIEPSATTQIIHEECKVLRKIEQ